MNPSLRCLTRLFSTDNGQLLTACLRLQLALDVRNLHWFTSIAILPGAGNQNRRRMRMRDLTMSFLIRLHKDEAGQGLVEYLLILALIAFAATAGMGSLASGLNSAFSAVGSLLGAYIT